MRNAGVPRGEGVSVCFCVGRKQCCQGRLCGDNKKSPLKRRQKICKLSRRKKCVKESK